MDNKLYFKELSETIPDYAKIVLIIFLIKDDENFLKEVGFCEYDISRSNLEFKNS